MVTGLPIGLLLTVRRQPCKANPPRGRLINTARYRTPDFDRADRLQAVINCLNRIIISPFSGELQSGKRCNNSLFFKEKTDAQWILQIISAWLAPQFIGVEPAQCER